MNIDKYVHWVSRLTVAVAVIMIGWGSSVLLGQPVTAWFAASTTIWMGLLLIAVFAVLGGGPLSVDHAIRQSDFQNRWPHLRAARLLFAYWPA